MLFNSYEFILYFLPVVVILFALLSKLRVGSLSIMWLVTASLFFYGWWDTRYLLLLFSSVVLNFLFGRYLSYRRSKFALTIGITANLMALGYFKYYYFFLSNLSMILQQNWEIDRVVLPLAISFFTFQQIAYLTDCFRKETEEHSFLQYCLFVTFFPQLIAGPIVHHKEMLNQFAANKFRDYDFELSAMGLSLFVIGLAKKVLIADNFALFATPVFSAADAGASFTFIEAWCGALAYTFQLYFDFSGYADMAVGLGMIFGIRLPVNFNSPYTALSIQDFWQRWHMTLSRFLKEYLYIPLGGNRNGTARRYINLMLTMLLGGLWHGAGWNFVIWGALHGSYLVINHLLSGKVLVFLPATAGRAVSCSITFICVVVAWVFFRAESFDGAVSIICAMLNPSAEGSSYSIDKVLILLFALASIIVWCLPNSQKIIGYINTDERMIGINWRPDYIWFVFLAGLFLYSLLQLTSVSEFLYFQF